MLADRATKRLWTLEGGGAGVGGRGGVRALVGHARDAGSGWPLGELARDSSRASAPVGAGRASPRASGRARFGSRFARGLTALGVARGRS